MESLNVTNFNRQFLQSIETEIKHGERPVQFRQRLWQPLDEVPGEVEPLEAGQPRVEVLPQRAQPAAAEVDLLDVASGAEAAVEVRQEEGAAAVPVQHVAAAHLRVRDDRGRRRHRVLASLHPRTVLRTRMLFTGERATVLLTLLWSVPLKKIPFLTTIL